MRACMDWPNRARMGKEKDEGKAGTGVGGQRGGRWRDGTSREEGGAKREVGENSEEKGGGGREE